MVVPNRFRPHAEDRADVLRALAVSASWAGVGAAGVVATFPVSLTGLRPLAALALLAASAFGVALATRVWLQPGWDAVHSAHGVGAGLLWLVAGFLLHPATGVVPLVIGAVLFGVGVAGLATHPRWVASPRRVGRGL